MIFRLACLLAPLMCLLTACGGGAVTAETPAWVESQRLESPGYYGMGSSQNTVPPVAREAVVSTAKAAVLADVRSAAAEIYQAWADSASDAGSAQVSQVIDQAAERVADQVRPDVEIVRSFTNDQTQPPTVHALAFVESQTVATALRANARPIAQALRLEEAQASEALQAVMDQKLSGTGGQ
jgi:hypothetical protein